VAGEDLGGRLRRGIDPVIGVAAGKRERRDREDDVKPHGRLPTYWRPAAGRALGRRAGEVGHQVPLGCAGGLASRSANPAEKAPPRSGFGGSEWSKRRRDTD
jgi:hypothetical protein